MSASPAPRGSMNAAWVVAGLVCATAPAWLFLLAAFGSFGGPRTVSITFALPVLLSTALAIWISVKLARGGSRRASMWVGLVALVVGAIAYVGWVYVAALGIQFGDGPL